MKPVIAIDGTAAAGKGTLARRLAATLGLPYLDTGLLYRAVGRRLVDTGGDPRDAVAAEAAARALRPEDLKRTDLRVPQIDAASSAVAAFPGVRAALLSFQREFAVRHGAVLDGRDIGTVIFPNATAKLYITATLAERARRRWQELRARGVDADLAAVEDDMSRRDRNDAARAAAPMTPAVDAYQLDTSDLDEEAVFREALAYIRTRIDVA